MLDLSGGFQNASSHILRKRQELFDSQNAAYDIIIGSAVRRPGYEPVGQIIQSGADSLYGGVYTFGGNNSRVLTACNNASASNAVLRFLDDGGNWTPLISNAAANTRFRTVNFQEQCFVAGETAGQYMPLTSINNQMQVSTSVNVLNAPACKYIAQYAGQLYAINCQVNVNGQLVTYRNRAYVSSAPMGVVTQVQTAVSGWTTQLHFDSVHYLKVGMQIDIYGAQTSNQEVSALTIVSVDKLNNIIGFSGQTLNVNIDDEVWISGMFGQQVILWNTDYPTPQSSDWLAVPPSLGEGAEFTGWTVNNNRLLLFTNNATLKWDGTNLVTLRSTVGCVNHETICNIGLFTVWLHSSGIWGYNDTTGQYKMISRSILPFLKLINPSNYKYLSAVTDQHNYKLSLSQLMSPLVQTTSTSTSSTSTSSTSSSTSSTSTSSTSTSSSITTTTLFTTSTSSTSTSISSTSQSSTSSSSSTSTSASTSVSTSSTSSSTSISTTSMSTSTSSTTTQPTGKQCIRLIYNFDLNIYWYEVHNREQRFQFIHTMNGYEKPYFTDENGYLFRDETGITDNGESIPFMIRTGRNNCGTEQSKAWNALQLDSENARGAQIYYSLDGGDWTSHPNWQMKDNIQTLNFPQRNKLIGSHDIDFMIQHNDYGEAPAVNGLTVYFNLKESVVNEMGESK